MLFETCLKITKLFKEEFSQVMACFTAAFGSVRQSSSARLHQKLLKIENENQLFFKNALRHCFKTRDSEN